MRQPYRVTLFYEEPTFDLWSGSEPRMRRGTYVIEAPTADDAVRLASEEFRRVARASAVPWIREIVGHRCEPIGQGTGASEA